MKRFIRQKNNFQLFFYLKDYMDQCAQEFIDNTFFHFFYYPEYYINLSFIHSVLLSGRF
jgi:hypothetical protein